MRQEHQTPADSGQAPELQGLPTASPRNESALLESAPAPLPDPFQYAVYLARLAATDKQA
jgi:hypothetical protein